LSRKKFVKKINFKALRIVAQIFGSLHVEVSEVIAATSYGTPLSRE